MGAVGMTVVYRRFRSSDREAVSGLIEALYKEDPGIKPMSREKIGRTFDYLLERPDRGTIIVLEDGPSIIGYAVLINFWSNEYGGNILFIDELFVAEGFRSHGIASEFLRYLADNRYGGCVALKLEVTPWNGKARRLYERIGFRPHRNDTLTLDLERRVEREQCPRRT